MYTTMVLLTTFAALCDVSRCAVQCWACKTKECERFEYTPEFITSCNMSSMCYKRVIIWEPIRGGNKTETFFRGCAPQSTDNEQELVETHWERRHTIHEVYPEGCEADTRDPDSPIHTTHCYCRGELCNGGGNTLPSTVLLNLLILLFILREAHLL